VHDDRASRERVGGDPFLREVAVDHVDVELLEAGRPALPAPDDGADRHAGVGERLRGVPAEETAAPRQESGGHFR
jgi:hypothetical protein